jgi:hypothetical protein
MLGIKYGYTFEIGNEKLKAITSGVTCPETQRGSTFTRSLGEQTLVLSCRRGDTLWLASNGSEFFLKKDT